MLAKAVPITDARIIEVALIASNSTKRISMANIAAPRGALNVAPTPAANPEAINTLLCLSLRLTICPIKDPKDAPIYGNSPGNQTNQQTTDRRQKNQGYIIPVDIL